MNNKPSGNSLKAIKYLKKMKDKLIKKPQKSPLSKRLKQTNSGLSERRNIDLKINTNIEYKG